MKKYLEQLNLKKAIIMGGGATFIIVLAVVFIFKGNNEQVSPITAKAQEQVTNKQSEKALNYLLDHKEGLDQKGQVLLEQLKGQYYPQYLEDADRANKDSDYVLAYEEYQKALKALPKDGDGDEIENNLRSLKKLVEDIKELQNVYDTYMITFNSTLKNSNGLLMDYKTYLDKLEAGTISKKDFSKHFKDKLKLSNAILSQLDNGLSITNTELLGIHKEVVTLMNTQHDMIITAISLEKPKKSSDESSNRETQLKDLYINIKEKQIEIIQEINDFVVKNHLKISSSLKNGTQSNDSEKINEVGKE